MSTPHIEAKKEDIASTVIMPGDPLRAKFIAETFLTDIKLINNVRNMFGYTGVYNGKKVTVMGSGMGMASMGIYSSELYTEYDVENIIRVGSCGAYVEELDLYDVVLVTQSFSETTFDEQSGESMDIVKSSDELNIKIENSAKKLNIELHKGCIHCTDVFYRKENNFFDLVDKYNCLGVEMESFALFYNAMQYNKKAACLLTVSDSFITHKETTSEEREKHFVEMIKIALESI